MEEAEGLAYDDPQSDSDAMVMGADSLHYPCMTRPPNPHLTPQGMQPHICWGRRRTICCHWRQQSPAEMLSRCMSMRWSWTTSEPEAHGWALHAMEDTLLNILYHSICSL